VQEMLSQITETNSSVIGWWIGSGDCPNSMTDKMSDVIHRISDLNIPQNGFTRNKMLWGEVNKYSDVRVALTVEKQAKAGFMDLMSNAPEFNGFLIAEPQYDITRVLIYRLGDDKKVLCGGGYTSPCGGGYVEFQGETTIEDCSLCQRDCIGCYGLKTN